MKRCTSNLKQSGRCMSTSTGKCVGGWSPVLQIEAAPPVHTEVIQVIERQSQYPIGVNPLFKGSGSPLFSHYRCYSNVTNHTVVPGPCNWITITRYRAICPFFLSGYLNSPLLGHRSASSVCSHRCRIVGNKHGQEKKGKAERNLHYAWLAHRISGLAQLSR